MKFDRDIESLKEFSEYPVKDGDNQFSDGTRMKNLVVSWNPTRGKKLYRDADMAQTCLPCD